MLISQVISESAKKKENHIHKVKHKRHRKHVKQVKPVPKVGKKKKKTDEGMWDDIASSVANAGQQAATWAAGKVLAKLSTDGQ